MARKVLWWSERYINETIKHHRVRQFDVEGMIMVLRSSERRHERHRQRDAWISFAPNGNEPRHGFGDLQILAESVLQPGARVPRERHLDAEIVTYVREGSLAYEDSTGASGVIHAGEFQRLTAGGPFLHSETNASRANVHLFQLRLRPSTVEVEPGREQRRFSAAVRRGGLCLVASADGRRGSLTIRQDALIYSAMLDRGQHVVHALLDRRGAWLHVVHGEVTLDGVALAAGDGAGLIAERAVSLTASEASEILLIDLGEPLPSSLGPGGAA
jgi:redox-sensitive bicupin YhaK (pirin superfamily)